MKILLSILLLSLASPRLLTAADLRIGIIGLDTSHVVAFTELINSPSHPDHVPGGRVTVAFAGGSRDVESSFSRIDGYTTTLREKYGVKIVGSIGELCREVDAVLLESVDGRPHLAQVRPVIKAGKPVFIDKPVAGSLRDAVEIFRLADKNRVPVFSSSAYRFYDSLVALKKTDIGGIRSAISYGPAHKEPHHPDLFWYGIHPTEALFTVMGTGCQTVVRTATDETDVVTGTWSDGRVGTLHALRTSGGPHKVIVFGKTRMAEQSGREGYAPLVREIMKFFQTGIAPVSPAETLEIIAFMEAADESARRGGRPVSLPDLLKKHRR